MSSGAASRMSGSQVVSMLRARANALRTASAAVFEDRRRRLAIGLNIARAWRGANPSSGQMASVNEAMRRAQYTYQRQRPPTATRTVSAAGKEQAPLRRRVARTVASRKRPTTSGRRTSRAVTEAATELMNLPDQPDFGGALDVGLIEAISRTVSASAGPAGLMALWNPPGPILSRPIVRLALVSGGLFTATALAVWAFGASKKQSKTE